MSLSDALLSYMGTALADLPRGGFSAIFSTFGLANCVYRVASSSTSCTPWGIAALTSRAATRAIASSPLTTFERRLTSRGRLPLVSAPRWSSTMANNNSSDTASEAAADAALRAMADPLDGLDEALTNEDLIPTAPWGLAVYRTAYGDDVAWHRMLDALETSAVESLALRGRSDLLERHQLVPIDDAATLDRAAPRDVRARFTQWAAEELRQKWRPEKPAPDEESARRADHNGPGYFSGVRYNYCLQVDDICLESLDHMASPVVKLVRKAWAGEAAAGNNAEEGEGEEEEEGYNEEEDVGWMYLPVCDYVECCNQLHHVEFWDDGYYVRPPLTFLERSYAHTPGFWRGQGDSV